MKKHLKDKIQGSSSKTNDNKTNDNKPVLGRDLNDYLIIKLLTNFNTNEANVAHLKFPFPQPMPQLLTNTRISVYLRNDSGIPLFIKMYLFQTSSDYHTFNKSGQTGKSSKKRSCVLANGEETIVHLKKVKFDKRFQKNIGALYLTASTTLFKYLQIKPNQTKQLSSKINKPKIYHQGRTVIYPFQIIE
jgi:hypothetical protein